MGCVAGLTATFEKQEDERGKQGGRKAGREEGREEGREGKGNYINKLPINRKAAITRICFRNVCTKHVTVLLDMSILQILNRIIHTHVPTAT